MTHASHAAATRFRQLVEHQLDEQRDEDDCQAPVGDHLVNLLQHPEQRFSNERELAVIDGEVEAWAGSDQLVLQLRAHVNGLVQLRAGAGGNAARRASGLQQGVVAIHLQHVRPRFFDWRHDGRDEVVLHGREPAALDLLLEGLRLFVVHLQLGVLVAVINRRAPVSVGFRVEHAAFHRCRATQQL